jgi:hypothetical protein
MLKQLSVKWVIGGIATGVFLTVLGFWDWGVAIAVFCFTAAYSQHKFDRMADDHRLNTRIGSLR